MGAAEEPCWVALLAQPARAILRALFAPLASRDSAVFWTPVRIAHLPMQYNALVNQANGVGGRVRIASRIEAARRGECR